MKKTKAKTKFTRQLISKQQGGRGGPNDVKISDGLVEEIEEEVANMEAGPTGTATATTTADEATTLFMQQTGLTEEEIRGLEVAASFLSEEVDISGQDEARTEEDKEAAEEEHDVVIERSFVESAAAKEQGKKSMGRSSLMAAAATGEALKSSGSSYFGLPTGATVTVQQDVVM